MHPYLLVQLSSILDASVYAAKELRCILSFSLLPYEACRLLAAYTSWDRISFVFCTAWFSGTALFTSLLACFVKLSRKELHPL
jgi:uncharacterized membrane protein YhdT